MGYLLDTNTCDFITKQNPSVIEAVRRHRHDGLFISSITLSEIEFGICKGANPQKYRDALSKLLTIISVLPYDDLAAAEYGRIRHDLTQRGCLIGGMDMLIAAHAKSVGLILVTNNTREFERVQGLLIEDWKA